MRKIGIIRFPPLRKVRSKIRANRLHTYSKNAFICTVKLHPSGSMRGGLIHHKQAASGLLAAGLDLDLWAKFATGILDRVCRSPATRR